MDKYEFKLKTDQMKALAAEGDYETAAEIADSINWRKVKNVNLLIRAGDIYIELKRYDEARDILHMAYDRSSIGRMIIYRLAELAVLMKNFDEAEEYYDEFVEIAPKDSLKYVLRYKIGKAKGTDIKTQIAILEELKEREWLEEWVYELAYLYHKAGESEKCIETCDELILWFGDGIYVERALELKMFYQPLSKTQEDKYRIFKQRKDGVKEIYPQEEDEAHVPIVNEDKEKFDTTDLQEKLAQNLQLIREATEKETIEDTMDTIKKIVEDIPYLKISHKEGWTEVDGEYKKAEEAIDQSISSDYKEMLRKDGTVNTETLEQNTMQDELSGWEKASRAAQTALHMAEQQQLETVKAKALQETMEIMDRLIEVIPKLDAGITPRQLMQDVYLSESDISDEERAGRYMAGMNDMLQQQIEKLQEEAEKKDADEHELLRKIRQAKPEYREQGRLRPESYINAEAQERAAQAAEVQEESFGQEEYDGAQEHPEDFAREPEAFQKQMDAAETDEVLAAPAEEEIYEELGGIIEEPQITEDDKAEQEELLSEKEPDNKAVEAEAYEGGQPESVTEALAEEMRLAEAEFYGISIEQNSPQKKPEDVPSSIPLKQDTKEIQIKKIEKVLEQQAIETEQKAEPLPDSGKKPAITKLNKTQKAIFSYFVPVAGMEDQICKVLTNTVERFRRSQSSASGHILIQGGRGCGKTVFATALIKALRKEVERPKGKVGRIDAASLNNKDLPGLLKKVSGGYLVVEQAGAISRETAVRLSLLLENDNSGLLVIMEDTRVGLEQAMGRDKGLAKKFTEKVIIPVFTSDELVEFGKAYAHELDYEIDTMGVLALYNRISNIQRLDQATTLTEVKGIIDEAIGRAEKKSIKKAFSILTARRYTKDAYVILREKDFEE